MIAPVSPLLLTSLKESHCFSERNTPPCTNCVCDNLGYFGRFSYRQTILVLLLFPKVTHLHFRGLPKRYMRSCRRFFVSFYPKRNSIGILEKLLNVSFALRGFIPLENLRAHLHTTIGSAVCKQTRALWGDPTPPSTSFVAKKKGTDYSVLLFSIFKVYASLSSRALQVGFADP